MRHATASLEAEYITHFLTSLQNLKTAQHELYRPLENNLCIVLKHLIVTTGRKEFPPLESTTESPQQQLEKLHRIAQMDEQFRRQIYNLSMMDNLEKYLIILNLETLKKLAEDIDNPTRLMAQLQHAREDQYKQLTLWEALLQKQLTSTHLPVLISFQNKIKPFGLFIYENSFINLSGELGLIFANILFKQAALNAVNFPGLFKIIGIVFGIYYTYMTGLVAFIRLLGLNQLALQATEYFTKPPTLNNENASIQHKRLYSDIQVTRNICFHTAAIFIAMLETMYFQDAEPIIRMIAGLSCSLGLMELSKCIIKIINLTGDRQSLSKENELLILFLLSQIGYELCQRLAGSIWQKSQARDAVIKAIRLQEAKGELAHVTIDSVDFYCPSALWFNQENPLHLRWQNPRDGFFYTTQCQIESPHDIYCRNPIKDFLTLSQSDFTAN